MRDLKLSLLLFIIFCLLFGFLYFFTMSYYGALSFSQKNSDWGNFGAFFGGVLAPLAALLSGYLVYKGYSSSAYQLKLQIIRQAISRMDDRLEKTLELKFRNASLDGKFYGLTLRDLIYFFSNNDELPTEEIKILMLAFFHNISIISVSIDYYIELLEEFPKERGHESKLSDLEFYYWIDKYSPICNRIRAIVGDDAIKNKLREHQLGCFIRIFNANKPF